MRVWLERFCSAARAAWRWFFPPRIVLSPRVAARLAFLYPTLDFRQVRFFEGMPHVLRWIPNIAITLPSSFGTRAIDIYFAPGRWQPDSIGGFGLVVHEAFHALQIRDTWGGRGLGLSRPFIVLYLAGAAKNWFRYEGLPLESDAYRLAGRVDSRFETRIDESLLGSTPGADPEFDDLGAFQESCGALVHSSSGLDFWGKAARSTPFSELGGRLFGRLSRALETGRASRPSAFAVFIAPASRLGVAVLGSVSVLMIGGWLGVWVVATVLLSLTAAAAQTLGLAFCGPLMILALILSRFGARRRGPAAAREPSP